MCISIWVPHCSRSLLFWWHFRVLPTLHLSPWKSLSQWKTNCKKVPHVRMTRCITILNLQMICLNAFYSIPKFDFFLYKTREVAILGEVPYLEIKTELDCTLGLHLHIGIYLFKFYRFSTPLPKSSLVPEYFCLHSRK